MSAKIEPDDKVVSLFKDLIDRNTAMKVITIPHIDKYFCPGCHSSTLLPTDNFCRVCGQRLDWEDDIIDVLEKTGKFERHITDIIHETMRDILIPLKEEKDDEN